MVAPGSDDDRTDEKGQKQPLSDDRHTLYIDMGADIFVKTHQTVCLRFIQFLIYKSVSSISIKRL